MTDKTDLMPNNSTEILIKHMRKLLADPDHADAITLMPNYVLYHLIALSARIDRQTKVLEWLCCLLPAFIAVGILLGYWLLIP